MSLRRTNTIRAPTSSSSIAPAWSREAELPKSTLSSACRTTVPRADHVVVSASLFGGEAYRVRGQRRARPLRGRRPTGHHVGTPGVNLANMTQAVCVISNTPVVPTAQGLTILYAPQQDLLTSAHVPCQNLAANAYTCWCLREFRQSCPWLSCVS